MGEERKISDKPRSGRPLKITEDDEKEIRGFIDENDPKKYGINASSYTTMWNCRCILLLRLYDCFMSLARLLFVNAYNRVKESCLASEA
ncbi:MAG: hypothetical protein QXS81_03805 [Candidatus Micrarchaeaceae archaeon]